MIGVLVSGNGTNLQALIDAGLPIAAVATWLEEHSVELVVLAGYMHLLTKPFLDRFPGRVVNVHPSLLPAFPGAHAIDDALAAGVETTGVTVHVVDDTETTGSYNFSGTD